MQMWKFFVLATRGSLDDTVLMKNILTLGVTLAILAGFIFVSFAAQKNNEQIYSVENVRKCSNKYTCRCRFTTFSKL